MVREVGGTKIQANWIGLVVLRRGGAVGVRGGGYEDGA